MKKRDCSVLGHYFMYPDDSATEKECVYCKTPELKETTTPPMSSCCACVDEENGVYGHFPHTCHESKCCGGLGLFGKCGRGTKKGCTGAHCRCMQKDCPNMHYVDCHEHYIHVEHVEPMPESERITGPQITGIARQDSQPEWKSIFLRYKKEVEIPSKPQPYIHVGLEGACQYSDLIGDIKNLLLSRDMKLREALWLAFQPFLAKYSIDRPIPPSELRAFLGEFDNPPHHD